MEDQKMTFQDSETQTPQKQKFCDQGTYTEIESPPQIKEEPKCVVLESDSPFKC